MSQDLNNLIGVAVGKILLNMHDQVGIMSTGRLKPGDCLEPAGLDPTDGYLNPVLDVEFHQEDPQDIARSPM